MKTLSIISIISFLMIISCTKDYGVKITKPGADLILSKMQSGNWAGATANGNKLNISNGGNLNGDYTFEEPVLGIGGIYKDSNGKYIMTTPVGDTLYAMEMNADAKKAVDSILDILDDEGGETVVGNLISAVIDNGAEKIDLSNSDKILAGTNLTPEKRAEIETILKASSGGFSNGQAIK
ncbi:hypothetical protein [Brachyspira hyodysenteriae]|uniref:hypothetical protein n=1 Tax=Brachyspira hyodysenteriae TaxID=159 RepID=UPI0022CD564C|nr:hypothetical protein [Brachyspira hyodysenteriae]MCZ9871296.1 hypothetical protein [Brachyspira hyodysenteriae]MCZ9953722.1 hypothetical protein [Brachyspira hyodysenteriae]MCZ9973851.1 hypothetical protein [Brachyspira hyodysenteriae]MCZ9984020.1 hypothetical protein [Brachyspira hyodysenteriae]MCZ9987666.1 hypothetical protein [Brachyspira hyodysenteriae]